MRGKKDQYAIQKDGCWLAVYHDIGIKEILWDALVSVPTGLYTSDISYARVFDSYSVAETVAKKLGAKVMVLKEDK